MLYKVSVVVVDQTLTQHKHLWESEADVLYQQKNQLM